MRAVKACVRKVRWYGIEIRGRFIALSVRQVPALFRKEIGMCGNRDKQLGEGEPSRRLGVSTVSGLCFRRFDFVRAAFRFFAARERDRRMKRLRVRVARMLPMRSPV